MQRTRCRGDFHDVDPSTGLAEFVMIRLAYRTSRVAFDATGSATGFASP
jgi:hypothetical protein